MCGLSGWFRLNVENMQREILLKKMCSAIAHRGPDDQDIYFDDHFGLGFQRLSILDLQGGHQPLVSVDGQVVISFNGEIFNHAALRGQLIRDGESFRSRSDTEVILKLYERDGIESIALLNGMFAIVIWDKRDRILHLVRDRLGVKPLYYAGVGNALLFGSEIKSILASGVIDKSVNQRAVWDYLTFRYVPGPQTIWEGVFKIPAGHRLQYRVGDNAPRLSRWWDMQMVAPTAEKSIHEYDEEFRSLFEDAVHLRMQADVPVGVTLSGGLDSSAIVAAAAVPSLHTFSVAFADAPDTNELHYARTVSKAFSTRHHEIVINEKDFLDFLPDFVWYTDEPLADLASIPLHYVSRLASQDVKVVLSGEGADEIFAGYDFDRWCRRWDRAKIAYTEQGNSGLLTRLTAPFFGREHQLGELATTITDQRQMAEPISMTNLWSSAEKCEMLSSLEIWPDSLDVVRTHLVRLGNTEPLNQVLYSYCQDWLVEDLLMKADRMSMANSLELRTPYLDYRLVEWAGRLPVRLKVGLDSLGNYRTKEILRRYAEPRLPRGVVDRPKQGFPVPVYGWLSGRLAPWARDTLLCPNSKIADWFKPALLQHIVKAGTESDADSRAQHRLWNVLILEIWMRRWIP
jgi:asparagine synthase (glutamine-hydrolysing)